MSSEEEGSVDNKDQFYLLSSSSLRLCGQSQGASGSTMYNETVSQLNKMFLGYQISRDPFRGEYPTPTENPPVFHTHFSISPSYCSQGFWHWDKRDR